MKFFTPTNAPIESPAVISAVRYYDSHGVTDEPGSGLDLKNVWGSYTLNDSEFKQGNVFQLESPIGLLKPSMNWMVKCSNPETCIETYYKKDKGVIFTINPMGERGSRNILEFALEEAPHKAQSYMENYYRSRASSKKGTTFFAFTNKGVMVGSRSDIRTRFTEYPIFMYTTAQGIYFSTMRLPQEVLEYQSMVAVNSDNIVYINHEGVFYGKEAYEEQDALEQDQ